MSRDRTVGETFYVGFTTRQFSDGVPTVLAGTPVISAYEDAGLAQITAGVSVSVSHDGVVGFNLITIVATGANGFEAGKDYQLVITTGTVGGVSVVGEQVGHFSLSLSAAAIELANATDGLTALKTAIDAIPTTAMRGTDGVDTAAMRGTNSALLAANVPTNFSAMGIEADGDVHADLKQWLGLAPNVLISGQVDSAVGIKKNTALSNFGFLMVDSTDHVTGKTGLTFAAANFQRSIDGGAFANSTNVATELANGVYKVNLSAADLNGDIIVLKATGTAADDRIIVIKTEA